MLPSELSTCINYKKLTRRKVEPPQTTIKPYVLVVSQKGWVGAGGGEYPEFINPFSAYFILKKITLVYPEYVEYIQGNIY